MSSISAGTSVGTALVSTGDTTGDLVLKTGSSATTAVTISGANQTVAVVSGSAAAPAIAPSGDSNTGIFFPAADTIAFAEGGTEVMRIDSSGRLQVGSTNYDNATFTVTTPSQIFSVIADGGTTGNRSRGGFIHPATKVFALNVDQSDGVLAFYQNGNTERMRIDSSGNLLVGGTTNTYNSKIVIYSAGGGNIIESRQTGSVAQYHVIYMNSNGAVGSIQTNGSSTSYVTSSDYRLKENIAPMTGALDTVSALKPVTYTWKADGSVGQGFIAHELQAVVPDCVTGEKDAVDADGNPIYQGIDTSFLVATLTAAIQELKAELDSAKAEIAELKAKVGT